MEATPAVLISSIFMSAPKLFYLLKVCVYGKKEDRKMAQIKVVHRAVVFGFSIFAGYMAAKSAGSFFFPIVIKVFMYYILMPHTETIILDILDEEVE